MYIEVNWSAGKLIQRKEVTCPKELEGFSADHAQVSQNCRKKIKFKNIIIIHGEIQGVIENLTFSNVRYLGEGMPNEGESWLCGVCIVRDGRL